jgi:hypothetical protein
MFTLHGIKMTKWFRSIQVRFYCQMSFVLFFKTVLRAVLPFESTVCLVSHFSSFSLSSYFPNESSIKRFLLHLWAKFERQLINSDEILVFHPN